ncbi:MAG TPA: hypothetical protein VF533_15435, partial [Solirubrobacteraceae bacterium]
MKRSCAVVLAAAALLAAAPAASAATYCVSKPGCTGTEATLANALKAAGDSPEPDRVEVGPGDYPTGSGFVYAEAAPNTLELVGSGPATVLRAAATPQANTFTVLRITGAGSAVRDLTVTPPAPSGAAITTGLAVDGGLAEGITVAKGAGSADASRGIRLGDGAELRRAVVSLVVDKDVPAVVATGDATLLDSQLTGGTGAQATGGARLLVRRTRFRVRYAALRARGATVEAESVLIVEAAQQTVDA